VCRHRPRPLPGGPHCRASDRLNSVGWCATGFDRPTSTLFAGSPPADGEDRLHGVVMPLWTRVDPTARRQDCVRGDAGRRHLAERDTTPKPRSPHSGFSRCRQLRTTTARLPTVACPSPCLEPPHAGVLNHRMRVWIAWRSPRGRIVPVPRRTKRCPACNPGSLVTLSGTGSSAHRDPQSPGTMRSSLRALRPSTTAALPQTDAGLMTPAQWPRIRPIKGRAADRG
jgi:hypothetical protein